MKIIFTTFFLLFSLFFLSAQEVLLQENFQDWAYLPSGMYLYPAIRKKIYNGDNAAFRGSLFAVFPDHEIGSEGIAQGNANPSNGCLVLTSISSYIQLPDLPSIGAVSVKANSFADQSGFRIQIFKGSGWVDIPGTSTNVSKDVIKLYSINLNIPSNSTIRIFSNQNDSLNIWDLQVTSFVSTIPKLEIPRNVSVSNITPGAFTLNFDKLNNAQSYDIRIYNQTEIVRTLSVSNQSSPSVNLSNLFSGVKYNYKIIAKGNGLNFIDSNPYSDSLVLPNRPPHSGSKIIFKFDDIGVKKGNCLSFPTINYLVSKNVKASYGVIALNCDTSSRTFFEPFVSAKNEEGDNLVEIWNHGYDHLKYNSLPEFSGTGYYYQKSHFDMATQLVLKNIDVQMNTFGTPWNQSDTVTNRVMSEDSNYKVFLCTQGQTAPLSNPEILTLNHFVYMEYNTGKPDFDVLMSNYFNFQNNFTDYMILQGHPNSWIENSYYFNELKRIILFLIAQGCDFVLPYEYYIDKTLLPPTNLGYKLDKSLKVKLTWQNNSVLGEVNRVERSTDMNNWILRATCRKDLMSFSDDSLSTDTVCYYYRVSATHKNKSVYSPVVKVNLSDTNLFQLKSDNYNIRLYPNPCKNEINLIGSFAESDLVSCDIYNQLGKKEKSLFDGKLMLGDFNYKFGLNLAPGLYYCYFYTSKGVVTRKIVVTGD